MYDSFAEAPLPSLNRNSFRIAFHPLTGSNLLDHEQPLAPALSGTAFAHSQQIVFDDMVPAVYAPLFHAADAFFLLEYNRTLLLHFVHCAT